MFSRGTVADSMGSHMTVSAVSVASMASIVASSARASCSVFVPCCCAEVELVGVVGRVACLFWLQRLIVSVNVVPSLLDVVVCLSRGRPWEADI